LGNTIFSTIRFCDDLGFDPEECIELAIKCQEEFDQFMKHELCTKHYIRYADDFVVLSENRDRLEELINPSPSPLGEGTPFRKGRIKIPLGPAMRNLYCGFMHTL